MKFKFSNLNLTLPHKELSNRNFVLYPLREISPNWTHPVTKKNIDLFFNTYGSHDSCDYGIMTKCKKCGPIIKIGQ